MTHPHKDLKSAFGTTSKKEKEWRDFIKGLVRDLTTIPPMPKSKVEKLLKVLIQRVMVECLEKNKINL